MPKKIAPYGTWESPIKPSTFAAGSVALDQIQVNEQNGKIYLLEIRPHEEGRGAIVEYTNGHPRDVLPAKYSALSQVHEYGGASFLVRFDGRIIFTDFDTKGVFILDPETQEVNLIGSSDPKVYFADFAVNGKTIVSIREDHHPAKIEDIKNTLVTISSQGVKTIVEGSDFYAFPRFSPDGKKICWVSWNHPAMPWTSTELWVASFEDGKVADAKCIAGKHTQSAVTQPVWGNDGSLFFADDQTGHWQLYRWHGSDITHVHLNGLEEADFACPEWWLGCQWYTPLGDADTLLAFCNKDGAQTALVINAKDQTYKSAGFPVNQVYFNSVKRVNATQVAVIGATATAPASFMLLDLEKPDIPEILKSSIDVTNVSGEYFSKARTIKFQRTHGPGGGDAYGVFLAPTNPDYLAPEGTLPPLIVAIHGGPTWQEGLGVYMRDQFWTTRGYAVVQVNYIGSSGFGRDYIKLLNGQWGVGDIADAASCVEHLVKERLVDGKRVGITGHSAGGYATMHAMCMYPDIYSCGVAESGISDIQVMAEETHKFEVHPSLFIGVLSYVNHLE
jgi:dipeptidyl aminopeptidase/acylaminoacyl peptidase